MGGGFASCPCFYGEVIGCHANIMLFLLLSILTS
jgi:hypothetical protein